MKAILKIILIVIISALFLPNSISNWSDPSVKDVWLTAPLDNEAWTIFCYTKDKDWKPEFKPGYENKTQESCSGWTIVQRLEIEWALSATALINKYISKLFNVLIKLWILISIWVIVFGWIVVSTSGSDDAVESWKWKIIGWVVAFLIIVLAWVILNTINPLYFVW